ncbi:MAG: hypothetical protein QOF51_1635, partial [Chloroflexota bacterium]|nr:hypothetical protein [Chloroflexota bacterium]
DLQTRPRVVTGRTAAWISARGLQDHA